MKISDTRTRDVREHLPLLQILSEIKNHQRQIIIDKLDDKAINALAKCIKFILATKKKKVKIPYSNYLSSIIKTNKSQINAILQSKKKRKRALTQIGGSPLALILSTVIPIITEEVLKQVIK